MRESCSFEISDFLSLSLSELFLRVLVTRGTLRNLSVHFLGFREVFHLLLVRFRSAPCRILVILRNPLGECLKCLCHEIVTLEIFIHRRKPSERNVLALTSRTVFGQHPIRHKGCRNRRSQLCVDNTLAKAFLEKCSAQKRARRPWTLRVLCDHIVQQKDGGGFPVLLLGTQC